MQVTVHPHRRVVPGRRVEGGLPDLEQPVGPRRRLDRPPSLDPFADPRVPCDERHAADKGWPARRQARADAGRRGSRRGRGPRPRGRAVPCSTRRRRRTTARCSTAKRTPPRVPRGARAPGPGSAGVERGPAASAARGGSRRRRPPGAAAGPRARGAGRQASWRPGRAAPSTQSQPSIGGPSLRTARSGCCAARSRWTSAPGDVQLGRRAGRHRVLPPLSGGTRRGGAGRGPSARRPTAPSSRGCRSSLSRM